MAAFRTRRRIIRAFVKQVAVSGEQIRIVYWVNTGPFAEATRGHLRKCVVGVLTPGMWF